MPKLAEATFFFLSLFIKFNNFVKQKPICNIQYSFFRLKNCFFLYNQFDYFREFNSKCQKQNNFISWMWSSRDCTSCFVSSIFEFDFSKFFFFSSESRTTNQLARTFDLFDCSFKRRGSSRATTTPKNI